jgi:sulfur-oxidizing protein SoxB
MEDVLAQTCHQLPATYVQSMTGNQIKDVLEDVCDNLFNTDPYYQQGGDMVPRRRPVLHLPRRMRSVGKRISDVKLDNGHALQAGKHYKVAGWASVNEQTGAPIWDVVANHLKSGKPPNRSALGRHAEGVEDNPGIADRMTVIRRSFALWPRRC